MNAASRTLFAHIVNRPEEHLELDVAAMLIGDWEYEQLNLQHYVEALDRFAEAAKRNQGDQPREPFAAIRALNRTLFVDLGFRGNDDDYYDPRNSFLHEVIDRRTGIPISLSVLYMEVARRMDLRVAGVSFPGHFLVRYDRYDHGEPAIVIDPFRMGLTLDTADLESMLFHACGPQAELTPDLLEPASKRQILFRMLGNLSQIYSRQGDVLRTVEVLERMRIIEPDDGRLDRELARWRQRAVEVN